MSKLDSASRARKRPRSSTAGPCHWSFDPINPSTIRQGMEFLDVFGVSVAESIKSGFWQAGYMPEDRETLQVREENVRASIVRALEPQTPKAIF